jgi:hypothetical protein
VWTLHCLHLVASSGAKLRKFILANPYRGPRSFLFFWSSDLHLRPSLESLLDMPRGDAPLLVQRPSAESDEQAAAEEDALLTGERQDDKNSSPLRAWGIAGLSLWAVLSTIVLVILAVLYNQARRENAVANLPHPRGKRNLIFMVSDGMGPSMLRLYPRDACDILTSHQHQ